MWSNRAHHPRGVMSHKSGNILDRLYLLPIKHTKWRQRKKRENHKLQNLRLYTQSFTVRKTVIYHIGINEMYSKYGRYTLNFHYLNKSIIQADVLACFPKHGIQYRQLLDSGLI